MHNQNIKYKQAREERLTSKYKQSRIQHKEQLKEKSAQLAAAFVDFQKRAAKMSPKDMDSDSEMAVLRWVFFRLLIFVFCAKKPNITVS